MDNVYWEWVLNVISSGAVLGIAAYLMRNMLRRVLTRSVEHHFEKKFENFKADLRDKEKELERISSFLLSTRRERDTALQSKRFEAGEILLQSRNLLSEFTLVAEYLKKLNVEAIMESGDDPQVVKFIETLISPINIDEKIKAYNSLDRVLPTLYLSERTQKIFEAYESIMLYAVMTMKMLSFPMKNKADLINKGRLSQQIIELVPSTRETFEEYGESYALFWQTYFYDETLKALRHELLEDGNISRDTTSAMRLAMDSRQAQIDLHCLLQKSGLPTTLMKSEHERDNV